VTSYVLVHGAFVGGWCWQRVARRLRAAGHDVLTPTLTGAGERFHQLSPEIGLATHVDDVVNVLVYEDLRDVVLVGHSYGGAVVTAAADRAADRVRTVVYQDAAAPQHGQSSTGAFADGTDTKLAELAAGGEGWLLPPLPLDVVGVTAAADVAWVGTRRHAHPMRTLLEPLHLAHGGVPPWRRVYVQHTDKQAMIALFGVDPLAPFVARAQAEGWAGPTIAAGHDAMITHADDVARVLLQVAT